MEISKITAPVIQKTAEAFSCACEKLPQTLSKTQEDIELKGLSALASYNENLVKRKNTLDMRQIKDGVYKGFEFYDDDKLIGHTVLEIVKGAMDGFLPESWYLGGKGSLSRDTKPMCFVSEIVINDRLKKDEYAKREGGKKYGVMCMQKILEWAKEQGCGERIYLEPALHGSNVHPGEFYAKIGFDVYPKAREILQRGDARRMAKGFAPMTNYDGRYISTGQMVVLTNPEVLKNYPL